MFIILAFVFYFIYFSSHFELFLVQLKNFNFSSLKVVRAGEKRLGFFSVIGAKFEIEAVSQIRIGLGCCSI